MKEKIGKLLLLPMLGLLTLAISCDKSTNPTPIAVYGCMDNQAINWNQNATIDDKTCYYVTTSQQTSNAVIELYTGVRAKYGPDAQLKAQNIQNNNPNNVIIVNIHTGSYAIQKAGWPDYTNSYGAALADSAGMNQTKTDYPGASVNRYHFTDVPNVAALKMIAGDAYTVLNREGYLLAANYWLAKISPVNIGIATYWTANTRTLKVMVEYYYTAAETYPNYLNVALLENGLVGKQISIADTLPNYVQDHVLRTFITGQWGELIPTTVGSRLKKTYEYIVPASINIDSCDVAAYINRDMNGKKVYILSGKQRKVKK